MSLLAIDVGNANVVATVPRGRGIDVVTSDSGHKMIPCVVSFQPERRFFADTAASQKISNRTGCFYHLPLILGEQLDSRAVQRSIECGAQYQLKAGQDGRAIASVFFGEEQRVVETEQLCAAVCNKVKQFAETMDNVRPTDVISVVPGRWGAPKKAAMKAAVESTGLTSLGVVSQHVAVGIGYYMRRIGEFQAMDKDNKGVNIAVLSIGEIESFFAVLQMNKNGITTLAHSASMEIGSIDFDKVIAELVEKMALQNCKRITLDELRTKKTQIKIMKAANTIKKTLTMNQKAPATLECVGDNQVDIQVIVTLEEFEQAVIASKLLDRIRAMIDVGLKNVPIKDIEAIELIGGSSRVKSLNNMIQQLFGESKLTKRMNPDEAVGFGLGWLGAIRSSKYKVPYEINISDLITNLSAPLQLHVYNDQNQLAFAKPLDMFSNGEQFPKSKKVTLRFQPGRYRAQLREGEIVHEETEFVIKSNDFEQFKDRAAAEAAGVDFNDTSSKANFKVIADQDGYFKLSQVSRSAHEVVFDDVKKKVPNPNLADLNAKRDEEIRKREEDFVKATAEYEVKLAEHAELVKKNEAEKVEKKVDAPEKPQKPVNPPEVPAEVEVTEKVPRVAMMSTDLQLTLIGSFYNVAAKAQELRQFELACQKIDQESLAYDAAINAIESVIYNTRDGLDFSLKQHVTDEEVAVITKLLDEAHEYAQGVEGKHQIKELKERTAKLEEQLKPYYARKQSHADLETQLYRAKSELECLKSKYDCPENAETFKLIDDKIAFYNEEGAKADKLKVVPPIFADFEKICKDFEAKLKAVLDEKNKKLAEEKKKADDEKKKAEEEKKKAEEEAKKAAEAAAKAETEEKK